MAGKDSPGGGIRGLLALYSAAVIGNRAGGRVLLCAAVLMGLSACGPLGNKKDPALANQELNAGLAAHYAGKLSEAQQHYKNAINDDPNTFFAYYNLGVIEQNAGQEREAESDYRKAISINPNLASAIYNLAIIRAKTDTQEAESLYRRAITLQPKWGTPHLNLGYLLQSEGRADEARSEFAVALTLDPSLMSRVPPSAVPSPAASPGVSPRPSSAPSPTR